MKTNVATTSIQEYYSLDGAALRDTVRGKVAAEIRRLTREGKRAYISLVAANLNMEKSTVAGRFNELKEQPFQVRGEWFKMEPCGAHPMPIPGDTLGRVRTVDTWGIIPCQAPIEQPTLF